ncbi:hypothetical protein HYH02_012161 [Chlamydomonas schloesseri]|uniref:Protein kinase domain-containing protein n=1 Tax=Chlamydomonas schloesseri TaxID=2026947 RepID=A0A835W0Q4_9CHLO|nr:hypothetical protein HYH02_012161 [Chlamydomonas schloesseri]|eukprot:KAG2434965.1 hypothetical protein HYH02_012161 [Chlamydomonas schloesseri]
MELMETNLEAMLYGTSVLEVAATATAAGRRVDMPNQAGAADTIISGEASKALGVCEGSAHLSKQLQLMKVLKIVVQIARALEYMAPTILHRDLKPANVLVNGADSPDPIVKLSDFGLSRLRAATVATLHPEAGTPAYLAPECFDVETRVVTHHADIYSLGVLCWAMLTGRRPWKDLSIPAVAYKVAVLGERPPLEQVGKQRCPPVLRALIRQMWEHDPLRRPAAAEVVLVLEGMLRAGTASIELYRLPPSIVSNVAIMSGSQHKVSGLGSDIFGGEYPQGGQQQHWGSLVADRWPWQRGSLDAQVIAAVSGGMAELQPLQVQPSRQRLASVPCGSQEFRQQSTHAGQTPTSNNELLAGLNQCTNACISLGGDSGTSSSSSSSGVADEEALARQLEELELDID